MADKTHVSWADTTWPVTVGCGKKSAGCSNCYAMRDARRMESNPNPKVSSVYSGLVIKQANGILNWTGTVKTLPERLRDPETWREHRDVFVCSQSDLFHEEVPDAFIGQVFSAIWNNSRHTYYILTKRPERLLQLLEQNPPEGLRDFNATNFPHVVVGISAENQEAAEKRLPQLLQLPLPASQLFVSAEPLIGPLNLTRWIDQLGWVIAGGESGKHARPMHPAWPRSLRDQCADANVLFHFKQWGEFLPEELAAERQMVGNIEDDTLLYRPGKPKAGKATPVLSQYETLFYRVGRKRAGRILDGQYWNARPGDNGDPILAPHPVGSTVTVAAAGEECDGLVGTIQIIQPDNPGDPEFAGEEATYSIEVEGRQVMQAFSYWQLHAKESSHE